MPGLHERERLPRVAHVATRLNVGGITLQVVGLSTALSGKYDVRVLFGDIHEGEEDMSDLAARSGIATTHITGLQRQIRPLADVATSWRLYRWFRRHRPVVVSTYMFKARLLGTVAARMARVPVVVETFNGTLFEGYFGSSSSRFLRGAERFIGRWLVDHVIATTRSDLELAIRHGVVAADKISHVPYGFDLQEFALGRAERASVSLREELSLGPEEVLVGIVGRLTPIKGHRYFLEAAAQLVGRLGLTGVTFVIVGDGELRGELEALAGDLGIAGRSHFLGTRRDMPQIYADLDVLVVSSLNEGTCIVIAEAMAAGTAVLATDVGGVPELVEDGVTGVLVPPADPSALAEGLVPLARDARLRKRFAETGRDRVFERHTLERMADATSAVYDMLLTDRDRATAQTGSSG